ncbi:dihydrofolate reductase family protein [Levilactobacillus bambusae]|uniref:Pyrimidine reductase n=1 Tax=Levilactobacillus bambusae TaxID=2024736 RepID=A0A2V1MXU6_9LACO|nr:dihydrofolate reductase family protein [Levilactobacillus bambusae]PWF99870.1 pyrimidine reductase [Levilactobacillus bambusae]
MSHITCHMLTTLDGQISGDFITNPRLSYFLAVYNQIHDEAAADAWICGRQTFEQDFTGGRQVDLTPYSNQSVPAGDFIATSTAKEYAIAIDPMGKLGWDAPVIGNPAVPGEGEAIIEVVCDQVAPAYLAFLRDLGISYVFAGKTPDLDLPYLIQRLEDTFQLTDFMLEGGGIVNASFLEAGLIDALSLVTVPMVAADKTAPKLFNNQTPNPSVPKHFQLKKATPLKDSGLWLQYETIY